MADASITGSHLLVLAAGVSAIWLLLAAAAAEYGRWHGFPWFPLFASALFLSWAVVLLAVAIGSRLRQPSPPDKASRFGEESRRLVELAQTDTDAR
jgi:hypothetical protein